MQDIPWSLIGDRIEGNIRPKSKQLRLQRLQGRNVPAVVSCRAEEDEANQIVREVRLRAAVGLKVDVDLVLIGGLLSK